MKHIKPITVSRAVTTTGPGATLSILDLIFSFVLDLSETKHKGESPRPL